MCPTDFLFFLICFAHSYLCLWPLWSPLARWLRFPLGIRNLLGMPMTCARCLRPDSILYDVFACVSVHVLYGLYPCLCCSQGRPKLLIPLHDLRLAVCPPRVQIMLCWHSVAFRIKDTAMLRENKSKHLFSSC